MKALRLCDFKSVFKLRFEKSFTGLKSRDVFFRRSAEMRWYEHTITDVGDFKIKVKEGALALQSGKEVRIFKDVTAIPLATEIKIRYIEDIIAILWERIEVLEDDNSIIIKYR